ncbi:MAG: DUF1992 domain-containing protein [Deltaproteobacteria bacterium]|nr:DUF1992 domain-containing protein [Deltaproteobacteria bacterium]
MDRLAICPVAIVAERKILEAMEQGAFDGLPGYGKPEPEDEFAGLPDEVRLCARILKSSSDMEGWESRMLSPSVSALLGPVPEGPREAFRGIERLELSLKERPSRKAGASSESAGASGAPESPRAGRLLGSPYLGRILARLF